MDYLSIVIRVVCYAPLLIDRLMVSCGASDGLMSVLTSLCIEQFSANITR